MGRKSKRVNCPFICLNEPFIGKEEGFVFPSVCRKLPLIGYKGFTLIELVIVLTIAGILVTIAAPGMQKFVSSNRLTSQANDLLADIGLARSEAIKRNTATGVCASTAGTSCTSAGNWASGWLVYYDNGGTKIILKTHDALTGANILSAIATDVSDSSTSSVDTVAYGKSGALPSQTYTYRFTVCDPNRHESRIIDLSVLGQATVSSSTC